MSLTWQSAADDDLRRRPADSRRPGKVEPYQTVTSRPEWPQMDESFQTGKNFSRNFRQPKIQAPRQLLLCPRCHCGRKLRPNRCRWRHGYYWQPIGSRQRTIRRHHRRPSAIYCLATICPWLTPDRPPFSETKSPAVARIADRTGCQWFWPYLRYGRLELETFRWKLRPNRCNDRPDSNHAKCTRWKSKTCSTAWWECFLRCVPNNS